MFDPYRVGIEASPSSWPSPAQDYYRGPLDLTTVLVPRPSSSFLMRVRGNHLTDRGLWDGDEIVVDRSLDPVTGDILIVTGPDALLIGTFDRAPDGRAILRAGAEHMTLTGEHRRWGVAALGIRHLRPRRRA